MSVVTSRSSLSVALGQVDRALDEGQRVFGFSRSLSDIRGLRDRDVKLIDLDEFAGISHNVPQREYALQHAQLLGVCLNPPGCFGGRIRQRRCAAGRARRSNGGPPRLATRSTWYSVGWSVKT